MNETNRFQDILASLANLDCGVPEDGDRYVVMIRGEKGARFITLGGIAGLARAARIAGPKSEEKGRA